MKAAKMKLITWMKAKHACNEASEWVGDKTPKQAWKTCEREDWMLWALGRTSIDKREIVRIACDIALSVLPLADDPRVAAAIDAAEGWCAGEVTIDELRQARSACCQARSDYCRNAAAAYAAAAAAYAAADAAAAYAAAAAAYAAADAAAADAAAAYAAAAAAAAAYAAADAAAAYAAAADAAAAAAAAWRETRADVQREIAELIRARVSPAEFSRLVSVSA